MVPWRSSRREGSGVEVGDFSLRCFLTLLFCFLNSTAAEMVFLGLEIFFVTSEYLAGR
jgi:hypothetical protein